MVNFGNSFERKVILFADSNTLYQLQNDNASKKILVNPELRVVNMDNSVDFLSNFRILGGILPSNNMMLVLSPFDDNTYIEISEAKNLITLDKLGNTMQLCQYLGASVIEILSIRIQDKKTDKSISFEGTSGTISGELNSKKTDISSLKNKIMLKTRFKGGEPDYETAKLFLKEKRLLGDVFLSKLLEMRNNNIVKNNQLQSITQEVCMTENLQNTFDLVSKINFPAGYFNTDYKSITEEKTEISLTIRIEF